MQPLRMTQVQPAKILRQVIADILNSVAMDEEKYPFQVVISGEFEKLQTEMDERLMKRVFQNVIGNAVRHNEEGCGIQVEAKCAKDQMVITVTDTGVGIPREICDYINDGGEEPSCHVMGLRIVKQIVNAHQGEIRIEEGHRICISIPVQNKD